MKNDVVTVLFAGVGGQGVVLSSEILARAAMLSGLDVKKTEVHGVAQRGGTVMSHVRFGNRVYSPLSSVGSVDILIALEKLEGLRFSHYLKNGGTVILNDEEIVPTRFIGERVPYPPDIESAFREAGYDIFTIEARSLAELAGSRRAFNVVVLGALADMLEIDDSHWKDAIRSSLPRKLHKLNLKAFEAGMRARAAAG